MEVVRTRDLGLVALQIHARHPDARRSLSAAPAGIAARRCESRVSAPNRARAGGSRRVQRGGTKARRSTSTVLGLRLDKWGARSPDPFHWLSMPGIRTAAAYSNLAVSPAPFHYICPIAAPAARLSFRRLRASCRALCSCPVALRFVAHRTDAWQDPAKPLTLPALSLISN